MFVYTADINKHFISVFVMLLLYRRLLHLQNRGIFSYLKDSFIIFVVLIAIT